MRMKDVSKDLAEGEIGKLLLRFAIPAVAAMLASSLYNIVDRAFIGHGVSALALSGLALTLPLMNLSAAVGSLIGTGSATLISIKLGGNDRDYARMLFGHSVVLNTIIGVVFGLLFLMLLDPILTLFGATPATIDYAREYMVIILAGNAITHLYMGMNCVLRAIGHPHKAMIATLITVLLNIVLDWLFIVVFGWGIKGAAVATILSQSTALVWQLIIFANKNTVVHFQRGIYRLKWRVDKVMFGIGMPSCLLNAAACIVVLIINRQLLKYGGDYAIGAYGITNSLMFIMVMIMLGITQAVQPIAGFNWGARKFNRVLQVYKTAVLSAVSISMAILFISQIATVPCIKIFTDDSQMIDITRRSMRIVFMATPVIAFQIITSNFFQSIGKPVKSIILSLSRQVIILIPILLILPPHFGTDGVWFSLPIADFISSILAGILIIYELRKMRRRIAKESQTEVS